MKEDWQFYLDLKEALQQTNIQLYVTSTSWSSLPSTVSGLNDPKQTPADHLNVFNLSKVQSGLGSFLRL